MHELFFRFQYIIIITLYFCLRHAQTVQDGTLQENGMMVIKKKDKRLNSLGREIYNSSTTQLRQF